MIKIIKKNIKEKSDSKYYEINKQENELVNKLTMTLHRTNEIGTDTAYAVTGNRVAKFDVIFIINNEGKNYD